MKNFINNPLFSSTLLSLRKTKDSRFAEGAIPFKRQYPHYLHCLFVLLLMLQEEATKSLRLFCSHTSLGADCI